jgi:uncharacterized protein
MTELTYTPPFWLRNGLAMTIYTAKIAPKTWEKTINLKKPPYQETTFIGAQKVPIHGIFAAPYQPKGTIIGTYGITGDLDNQWFLKILGRKAYADDYAVVFFDWRAHGKTAQLSPTLTSDGLYEGQDFVEIAMQAKELGCPPPYWFTGYSLGGQLALWGIKFGENNPDIAGGGVICPSLDSLRSLTYLVQHPLGKYLEKAVTKGLKELAWDLHRHNPQDIDPEAINRANSIWGFDEQLVIEKLGFKTVPEYYQASSALQLLPTLKKPTFLMYAKDDPMFDPNLIPEIETACQNNPNLTGIITEFGGHVGYFSSKNCQEKWGDNDPWWAWNRMLQWTNEKIAINQKELAILK